LDSNEIDESDSQNGKHEEPRISTLLGIAVVGDLEILDAQHFTASGQSCLGNSVSLKRNSICLHCLCPQIGSGHCC
jgi:hypothetical protein